MRLDHFLLSPNLSVRLVDGGVDRWARGHENASDQPHDHLTLDRSIQPAFLCDRSQQRQGLPFPFRLCILSIRIRNLTQCPVSCGR